MDKAFIRLLSTHVAARRAIIVLVIILLGMIDLATGYEYSFSVFYLLPVSMAAWYDNYKVTFLTVIASGLTWLYADSGAGHVYSNALIPFWNATVRMGFFSVVAFLLFRIRRNWTEMKQMAMKDQLTGLNNLRAFEMEYRILRKISFRKHMQFAVGLIDLDGFKAVNDHYGHHQGDDVLQRFSRILKKASRGSDVVARLGGDEFAVILLDVDEHTAGEYDTRLRELFAASQLKQDFGVDFSMGMMIFNALPDDVAQATSAADKLMYHAKAAGKCQTTIERMAVH